MRAPSPDFVHILCVFVGGGLGSVMRYLLSIYFNDPQSNFPVGTFLANSIGGFMIAVFSCLMDAVPNLGMYSSWYDAIDTSLMRV